MREHAVWSKAGRVRDRAGRNGRWQPIEWVGRPTHPRSRLARLDTAPRYHPMTLTSRDVPTDTGLYVWYDRRSGNPVDVGKACGRRELRRRIWSQHLNPRYLERREPKFTEADSFQRGCRPSSAGAPAL